MYDFYFSRITTITKIGVINNLYSETYITKLIGNGSVILTGLNIINKSSIMIINNTGHSVTFENNSSNSEPTNRIKTNDGNDFILPDKGTIQFKYSLIDQVYTIVNVTGTNSSDETDPIYSISPSSNINQVDLSNIKNLETTKMNADLFSVIADGSTDIYNITHGFNIKPKSVFLTRCNMDSVYTNVDCNETVITVTLQNVPPQGATVLIYWMAVL